jgi:hypothetical protein
MRHCLYGGPGAGKSTAAAALYARLKAEGGQVELVRERVKEFAHLRRVPTAADRVRFFGEEVGEELAYCQLGLDVVSDSPLWLACFHARRADHPLAAQMVQTAARMDELYPARHLFLPRAHPYDPVGRYESAAEAAAVDAELRRFLADHGVPVEDFR